MRQVEWMTWAMAQLHYARYSSEPLSSAAGPPKALWLCFFPLLTDLHLLHYFQHEPVIYKEEGELQETGCSSCMSHSGLWRSSDRFRVYSRLSNEQFNKHFAGESWTGICRDRSNFWEAISPKKRSAICLRWVIYVKIKREKRTLLLSLFRIKQCI